MIQEPEQYLRELEKQLTLEPNSLQYSSGAEVDQQAGVAQFLLNHRLALLTRFRKNAETWTPDKLSNVLNSIIGTGNEEKATEITQENSWMSGIGPLLINVDDQASGKIVEAMLKDNMWAYQVACAGRLDSLIFMDLDKEYHDGHGLDKNAFLSKLFLDCPPDVRLAIFDNIDFLYDIININGNDPKFTWDDKAKVINAFLSCRDAEEVEALTSPDSGIRSIVGGDSISNDLKKLIFSESSIPIVKLLMSDDYSSNFRDFVGQIDDLKVVEAVVGSLLGKSAGVINSLFGADNNISRIVDLSKAGKNSSPDNKLISSFFELPENEMIQVAQFGDLDALRVKYAERKYEQLVDCLKEIEGKIGVTVQDGKKVYSVTLHPEAGKHKMHDLAEHIGHLIHGSLGFFPSETERELHKQPFGAVIHGLNQNKDSTLGVDKNPQSKALFEALATETKTKVSELTL